MRAKDQPWNRYCVYHTFYYGNKMPQNYVGSTSVKKVIEGYHGSVSSKEHTKIWKSELKKNPHLFRTIIVGVYDTREDALEAELKAQLHVKAATNNDYINRAYASRNFHHMCPHTPETIEKMLKSRKNFFADPIKKKKYLADHSGLFRPGHIPWSKGLTWKMTEEEKEGRPDLFQLGHIPWNTGLEMTKEYCNNIKRALSKRTPEQEKIRIESQRQAQLKTWKNKSTEDDQERRDNISKAQKGRSAMRDLETNKRWVTPEDIKKRLSEGWTKGWK